MAVEQRLYTVEEFEQFADSPENSDRLLELIDGEIIEKMPTEEHGNAAGNIYGYLWQFNRVHKLGRVVIEVRYRSVEDEQNARIPDVAFTLNPTQPLVKRGSVPRMPDLAVEVKSPDQSVKEMRDKVRYYLANGMKMVWLLFTDQRIVEVYTADEELILTEDDLLTGGTLLPGFSMPVREIFVDTAGK